eukprot:4757887-Alexandrium_andersonii.AAC.1
MVAGRPPPAVTLPRREVPAAKAGPGGCASTAQIAVPGRAWRPVGRWAPRNGGRGGGGWARDCLLYTSDAADDM